MIITIDGPAASGKSTVARALAKRLGAYYLYTGLLYRAVAFVALRKFLKTVSMFADFTEEDIGFISEISYEYDGEEPKIFYQEEDITEKLYDKELSEASSIISANKHVREALLSLQRAVAKKYDIVADGRDCGSKVFPDADYKFFLTASLEVRAKRALGDEQRKNKDLSEVEKKLAERDKRDQEREVSPLKVPDDATIIDNSELDIKETIEKFLSYIKL